MTELQQKLLAMLCWFHDFCTKENLRYFAIAGTFLGAVRHGGFIPWDDDIDVGLPRKDYERCREIFARTGNRIGKYALETPYSPAEDFLYSYDKLYDTTTTLVERQRTNCRRGIYLDIFPLDGAGDTMEDAKRYYKQIDAYKMLLAARVCAVRKERAWHKNLAILAARAIPSAVLSEKELCVKMDALCKERDYDESAFVGSLMSGYRDKAIMPKEIFGEPTMYQFEGKEIMGPEKPEAYLAHLYGDWRKLPPEEKRGVRHDFAELDLEHGWVEQE